MSLFIKSSDEETFECGLQIFFSFYGNTKTMNQDKVRFHKSDYWESLGISNRAFLMIAMDNIEKNDVTAMYDHWKSGKKLVFLYKQLYET